MKRNSSNILTLATQYIDEFFHILLTYWEVMTKQRKVCFREQLKVAKGGLIFFGTIIIVIIVLKELILWRIFQPLRVILLVFGILFFSFTLFWFWKCLYNFFDLKSLKFLHDYPDTKYYKLRKKLFIQYYKRKDFSYRELRKNRLYLIFKDDYEVKQFMKNRKKIRL